jgi:hypothetical protein
MSVRYASGGIVVKRIVIGVAVILVLAATALATTYRWPPTKRPPITLDQAFSKAVEHIGDRSKTCYCIAAYLLGNEAQDGKEGAWNFTYRSEKDDYFIVTVQMDGKISVQERGG